MVLRKTTFKGEIELDDNTDPDRLDKAEKTLQETIKMLKENKGPFFSDDSCSPQNEKNERSS